MTRIEEIREKRGRSHSAMRELIHTISIHPQNEIVKTYGQNMVDALEKIEEDYSILLIEIDRLAPMEANCHDLATVIAGKNREIEKLRGFIANCFDDIWETFNGDLDGGNLQDYAEKHGIIVELPIDKDCPGSVETGQEYDTDKLYYLVWSDYAIKCKLAEAIKPEE